MKDLLLTLDGDLRLDSSGDISITDSVQQAILVRLRWFLEEWRLGPSFGLPYYEEVFIKNPNIGRIRQMCRDAILEVEEVTDATILSFELNEYTRKAVLAYEAIAGSETIREEVMLDV